MNNLLITSIGLLGASLTTFSSLPQVIKIIKTKRTKDISLITYLMLTIGVLSWLLYGVFITDIPLILANLVSIIFILIILIFKIKYK